MQGACFPANPLQKLPFKLPPPLPHRMICDGENEGRLEKNRTSFLRVLPSPEWHHPGGELSMHTGGRGVDIDFAMHSLPSD